YLAIDLGERAVAIVAIHARGMAVGRGLSGAHGVNDVLMNGPGILNDVEPPVIVDVAPLSPEGKGVVVQVGLRRDIGESSVAVVAVKLRRSDGVGQKQVRVAIVVVILTVIAD